MLRSILLLLLLGLAASGIQAQTPASVAELPIGTQARLFTPSISPNHWQGTVVGQRGDTLLLAGNGRLSGRVPIDAIERAEVRRGSDYARGIRSGTIAGAAAFGGMYLLEARDSYGGVQLSQLATALVWGAGVGGFLGFVAAPARWEAGLHARAQLRVTDLPLGTRVRVAAPDVLPSRFTGRATGMKGDTLLLMKRNEDLVVPFDAVRSLEISRGRDRLLGGAIGVLAGAAAGLAWGAILDAGCTDYCFGLLIGPILGVPTGAVAGALIGKERWERIPLAP